MATQIADATNCITITIAGVVVWTIPKRGTALEVNGTTLKFHREGVYVTGIDFADVSSPSTADVEALRTAVNNILIS